MARRKRRARPSSSPPARWWAPDPEPDPEGRLVLAGNPVATDEPMTEDEALRILAGSCDRKHRYETWSHAHADANSVTRTTGERTTAYQCPFGSHRLGKHWHVGHPPTIAHMQRLALAVRFLAEHPDCVPRHRLR